MVIVNLISFMWMRQPRLSKVQSHTVRKWGVCVCVSWDGAGGSPGKGSKRKRISAYGEEVYFREAEGREAWGRLGLGRG